MNNLELSKELTRLLMESYDRGAEDAKAAALEAIEHAVAVAIAAEREACAKVCEDLYANLNYDLDCRKHWPERKRQNEIYAAAIRARGNNAS